MELLLSAGAGASADIGSDDTGAGVSPWVRRWSHLVPAGADVLDVACGSGRHLRWFAARGHRVTGVDRDAAALAPLGALADIVCADIEAEPWPFAGRRFDAVVVTRYLWRPLLPTLVDAVADGGVLIYETFADGQRSVGKPSNPTFLLRPGELIGAVAGLRIVAFEDGFEDAPERFVQRIVAVREPAVPALPPRYQLESTASAGRLNSPATRDTEALPLIEAVQPPLASTPAAGGPALHGAGGRSKEPVCT